MIRSAFCNVAKEAFLRGQHREGHILKCALFPAAANLDKNTVGLTPEVAAMEVQGFGYTAGGKALLGVEWGIDGDVAFMSFMSITWPMSSITARGCLIYNNSLPGRPAIAVKNFGRDIVSSRGNFHLAVPKPTAGTAIIRIS